jgi:type I restriction enzyme S subunit
MKMDKKSLVVQEASARYQLSVGNASLLPSGYKQTEAGVIPEDWELQEVGGIATTVASGRSHVNSQFGDFPVYGSTGIIGRCTNNDYAGKVILIARVGANAGKLYVVDGEYGVTDNTIMVKIDNLFHIDYFWRQLEAKRLNSMVFGSGQPLITGTQIKGLAIPFPPTKAEQEAIAEALSDTDALIESLEQLIAKKRYIKQGSMQE